jgi:hypothetical protein
MSFIDETLKKRNAFYVQAQYQVDRPNVNLDEVMEMIK